MTRIRRHLFYVSCVASLLLFVGPIHAQDSIRNSLEIFQDAGVSASELDTILELVSNNAEGNLVASFPPALLPEIAVVEPIDWAAIGDGVDLLRRLHERLVAIESIRAEAQLLHTTVEAALFEEPFDNDLTGFFLALELIHRATTVSEGNWRAGDAEINYVPPHALWARLKHRRGEYGSAKAAYAAGRGLFGDPDLRVRFKELFESETLPQDAIEYIVQDRLQRLEKEFAARFCVDDKGDRRRELCAILKSGQETSVDSHLLDLLKKDFSTIRQLVFAAAKIAEEIDGVAKACEPDRWIDFDIGDECFKPLIEAFEDLPTEEASVASILGSWIGVPINEVSRTAILTSIDCVPTECEFDDVVAALQAYLGPGVDPFSREATARLAVLKTNLNSLLKTVQGFENRDLVVAKTNDRSLVVTASMRDVELSDQQGLSIALRLLDRTTSAPPAGCKLDEKTPCPNVISDIPVGLIFQIVGDAGDLSSLAFDDILDFAQLSDRLALIDVQGAWHLSKEVFREWLSKRVAPRFFKDVGNYASMDLEADRLVIIEGAVALIMPWAAAEGDQAVAGIPHCRMNWDDFFSLGDTSQCIETRLLAYLEESVLQHLGEWVGDAEGNLLDELGSDTLRSTLAPTEIGITRLSKAGLTVSLSSSPSATLTAAWDGTARFDADEALRDQFLRRLLSDVTYLRFDDVQTSDSSVRADVFWSPPAGVETALGQAIYLNRALLLRPAAGEEPTITVPGIGHGTLQEMSINLPPRNVRLILDPLTTDFGFQLGRVGLTLDSELVPHVTPINPAQVEVAIRQQLLALGLRVRTVTEAAWDSSRRGLLVDLVLENDKPIQLFLGKDWQGAVQKTLDSFIDEQATQFLDTLFVDLAEDLPTLDERFGPFRFTRNCTNAPLACEIVVSSRSAPACDIWRGTLNEQGYTTTSGAECVQRWIDNRWFAGGDVSVGAVTLVPNSRDLNVGLNIRVQDQALSTSAVLNLVTGATRFDSAVEDRARAILSGAIDQAIEDAGILQRLETLCSEFRSSLSPNNGVFSRKTFTVDGMSECEQVSWQSNLSHTYRIDFSIQFSGSDIPVSVSNVELNLAEGGLRFDNAEINKQSFRDAIASMISPSLVRTYELGVVAARNGVAIRTSVPVSIFDGVVSTDIPIELSLNADGADLKAPIVPTMLARLVEACRAILLDQPFEFGSFSMKVDQIDSDTINSEHFLVLKLSGIGEFFDTIGQQTVLLNVKTGDVRMPDVEDMVVNKLTDEAIARLALYAKTELNRIFGDGLVIPSNPRLQDCETGDFDRCHVRMTALLDLGFVQIPMSDVLVFSEPRVEFDGPTTVSLPLGGPYFVGPASLGSNRFVFSDDSASLRSSISFADLQKLVKIAATVTVDVKDGSIRVDGDGILLEMISVGTSKALIESGSMTTTINLGGALKKILTIKGCAYIGENKCTFLAPELSIPDCDALPGAEKLTARACGYGDLFQFANFKLNMGVSDDLALFANTQWTPKIIPMEVSADFRTQRNLSSPNLRATLEGPEVADIKLGSVDINVSTGGAAFRVRALGLKVGFVLQNLHEVEKDEFEKLLVALLLPKLNLKDLLDALLSGNMTVNPFSSFGKGGGDTVADGGKDGDGGVGGEGGAGEGFEKQSLSGVPGEYSGEGNYQSVGDFQETKPGVIRAIQNREYQGVFGEKIRPGETPVGLSGNYELLRDGKFSIDVQQSGALFDIFRLPEPTEVPIATVTATHEGYELIRGGRYLVPKILYGIPREDPLVLATEPAERTPAFLVLRQSGTGTESDVISFDDLGLTMEHLSDSYYLEDELPIAGHVIKALLNNWKECTETARANPPAAPRRARGSRQPLPPDDGQDPPTAPVLGSTAPMGGAGNSPARPCPWKVTHADYDNGVVSLAPRNNDPVRKIVESFVWDKDSNTSITVRTEYFDAVKPFCNTTADLKWLSKNNDSRVHSIIEDPNGLGPFVLYTPKDEQTFNVSVTCDGSSPAVLIRYGDHEASAIESMSDTAKADFYADLKYLSSRGVYGLTVSNIHAERDIYGYVLKNDSDIYFRKAWSGCDWVLRKLDVNKIQQFATNEERPIDYEAFPECRKGSSFDCAAAIASVLDQDNYTPLIDIVPQEAGDNMRRKFCAESKSLN